MARTVRENNDEVQTEVVEESSLHIYRTENGYIYRIMSLQRTKSTLSESLQRKDIITPQIIDRG
jgi:hypothetical protein